MKFPHFGLEGRMKRHFRHSQMQAQARAAEKHEHFSETENVVAVEKSLAAFVFCEVILGGTKQYYKEVSRFQIIQQFT